MKKVDLTNLEKYYAVRDKYDKSIYGRLSHSKRVQIHPLLLNIIKLKNKLNGFEIDVISDKRVKSEKPKIFCVTHIGKFDIEVVSEAIGDHYYLLSGDFENIKGTIEEKFLGFNGVVYVREDDKADRKKSKDKMVDVLKNGGNLMYFPEGTWNLSANLPVLKCPYGIIDVAMQGGAEIVPIAIEQYGNKFKIAIGEQFDLSGYSPEDKAIAIEDLRGVLAGLKWDIWESLSDDIRNSLNEESFENYIADRLKEWPNFTFDEFIARVFKPKSIVDEKDVFKFLENVELNTSNAFLAKDKEDYQKQYVKRK